MGAVLLLSNWCIVLASCAWKQPGVQHCPQQGCQLVDWCSKIGRPQRIDSEAADIAIPCAACASNDHTPGLCLRTCKATAQSVILQGLRGPTPLGQCLSAWCTCHHPSACLLHCYCHSMPAGDLRATSLAGRLVSKPTIKPEPSLTCCPPHPLP